MGIKSYGKKKKKWRLIMTKITVYDIEAEDLHKIADVNDITVAEVVEMLMAYAEEMKKDNGLN
jgi:hypothetical protein